MSLKNPKVLRKYQENLQPPASVFISNTSTILSGKHGKIKRRKKLIRVGWLLL